MATATLLDIQNKVRRLTRSPSTNQLSTTTLDDYINTFIMYDLPEELRLFDLHKQYNLPLDPYVDTYDLTTLTASTGETLSNYMVTINQPFYVDGYKCFYSQSPDEFYNVYPKNQNIVQIGTGDGTTVSYSYTIANGYLLANNVQVTSVTATNTGLYLTDDGAGTLTGDGTGTVDYVTGAINVTFSGGVNRPAKGKTVSAHVIQYTPNRPAAVLYFDNSFTIRPVPDKPYTLNFEYYVQPTQLLATGEVPELKQWWQYIAYGAAIKVLQDRMDNETVQALMPEFNKQMRLVLRRTLVLLSNQRTATIYSQQSGLSAALNNFYNGF